MPNHSWIQEFDFTLLKGLIDERGNVHRQGLMRLATAKDEIYVQADRRVQQNPGFGVLVMLSRVIVRLGNLSEVTPEHLENLFTLDMAYLREVYNRLNQQGTTQLQVQCPKCANDFKVELTLAGEP